MEKSLSGLSERASSTQSLCSWSVKLTLTRKMFTLELRPRRKVVVWPLSTLVVFPLTSPKIVRATSLTLPLLRTAQSTCAPCLTLSSTWRLTLATLALSTELDAIRFGTKRIVPSSWLVLMTGQSEFGTPSSRRPSLLATRLSHSKNRLMILTGHLTLLQCLPVWQTTVGSKSGISRLTL